MVRFLLTLFAMVCMFGLGSCGLFEGNDPRNTTASVPDSLLNQVGRRLPNMRLMPPDTIGPLDFDGAFSQALLQQTLYLLRSSTRQQPMRSISKEDLVNVIHPLQNWRELTP